MRASNKVLLSSAAQRLFLIAGTCKSLEDAAHVVGQRYTKDVDGPPTDLDAIAIRLNIQEIRSENLPVAGELRRSGKGYELVYSSDLGATRRRFTIAHEIAHAILETSGPNCPRRGEAVERICDMLAAELLMPRQLFLSMAGTEPSAATVLALARTFQTSISATGIRYAKLKRVSVFQVDDERVVWGSGLVRGGSLRSLDYSIQSALSTISGDSGSDAIYHSHAIWTGEWKLSWESLGQQRLFVLHPP